MPSVDKKEKLHVPQQKKGGETKIHRKLSKVTKLASTNFEVIKLTH